MQARIPLKSITEIDGTVYIIENTVSPFAKESAYDKIKRMILSDAASKKFDAKN